MAFYSIVTGNGFTGNAQRCSGSRWEGINLSTNSVGKKYSVSFWYRSNSDLAIYSGDYNEVFTEVNTNPILINTGSARLWIGEYLSISNVENFLGLKSEGWFEIDQLRVNEIPNLVTNGTFDADTNWNKEAGWTISSGSLNATNAPNTNISYQSINVATNKTYRVSYTVSGYVTGSVGVYCTDNVPYTARTANGIYTEDMKVAGTILRVYVRSIGITTLNVDNIHVYEVPDYTYSGNHSYKYTLSDKYATTSSLYISASGAGRGDELVTNGDFLTASNWTSGSGWSIYNGKLSRTVTGNFDYTTQAISITTGKTYEVSLTISDYYSGMFRFYMGGGSYSQDFTATGSYKVLYNHTTGAPTLYLWGSQTWSGSIDRISVTEYLGEVKLPYSNFTTLIPGNKYTLEGFVKLNGDDIPWGPNLIPSASSNFTTDGTGWWNIGQGTKSWVSSSGVMRITQITGSQWYVYKIIPNTTSGNVYKISLKYRGISSNRSLIMDMTGAGIVIGTTTNAWQEYTYYHKATGTQFRFQNTSTVVDEMFEFDDISIQEAVIQPKIFCNIGSKIVSSSILNPQSWTKFALTFEATSNEVNQDIKLYLNTTGSVWVDNISITQAYDMAYLYNIKRTTQDTGDGVIGFRPGSWNVPGEAIYLDGNVLRLDISDGPIQQTLYSTANLVQTGSITSIYTLITDSNIYHYKNNVINVSSSRLVGNAKKTLGMAFGAYGDFSNKFSGSIGQTQMIRFANINSSNFNPTTHRMGWPISGGGAEVVFWFDPSRDGSNISQSLQDWSGTGNVLSGSNIDITNRILFT